MNFKSCLAVGLALGALLSPGSASAQMGQQAPQTIGLAAGIQRDWAGIKLNLTEAAERIPAAELVVRQADENLELANGRYAAGLGNPVEVTDSQIVYSNAKTSHIQALSDYNVAIANLEKAMGVR